MSPKEVFGDIMVLASPLPRPPPRPPIHPDDVNTLTRKVSTDLFQIIYEGRYLRYVAIEI